MKKSKKTIKDTVGKPSAAIAAAVKGYRNHEKLNISLSMDTFGTIQARGKEVICFGCLATCAVHQIAKKAAAITDITSTKDRKDYLFPGEGKISFDAFEWAIDRLRLRNPIYLFKFFYPKKGAWDSLIPPKAFEKAIKPMVDFSGRDSYKEIIYHLHADYRKYPSKKPVLTSKTMRTKKGEAFIADLEKFGKELAAIGF